jgi:hypothetical protein
MRNIYTTVILLALIFLSGCRKEPIGKNSYIKLYYKQTSCSDPWATGTTDSLTLVNVAAHLNSLNLYIAGLSILNDDTAEACSACTCKTGKTIYVSTFNSDSLKAQYTRIGFKQY